jgi:DHA2 family multidrug resistance protein
MAMAIFGIGTMFGPIIGPLLGGWITDNWSWHWIFYINIPIGIVSILMALLFITDPPYMQRTKMQIDYWGLVFLAIGIGCLQIVLDKGQREDWFSSRLIVSFALLSFVSLLLLLPKASEPSRQCYADYEEREQPRTWHVISSSKPL